MVASLAVLLHQLLLLVLAQLVVPLVDKFTMVRPRQALLLEEHILIHTVDPPHYFAGNTIAFSCMAGQTALVLILRILLARENKRRSRLSEEQRELEIHKYGGMDLVGDRHYSFKYVL